MKRRRSLLGRLGGRDGVPGPWLRRGLHALPSAPRRPPGAAIFDLVAPVAVRPRGPHGRRWAALGPRWTCWPPLTSRGPVRRPPSAQSRHRRRPHPVATTTPLPRPVGTPPPPHVRGAPLPRVPRAEPLTGAAWQAGARQCTCRGSIAVPRRPVRLCDVMCPTWLQLTRRMLHAQRHGASCSQLPTHPLKLSTSDPPSGRATDSSAAACASPPAGRWARRPSACCTDR